MPIYEYRCPVCGTEVELLQKFDDPAPTCSTEKCQAQKKLMQKKISRSTFELRGSGWAKDGYGS